MEDPGLAAQTYVLAKLNAVGPFGKLTSVLTSFTKGLIQDYREKHFTLEDQELRNAKKMGYGRFTRLQNVLLDDYLTHNLLSLHATREPETRSDLPYRIRAHSCLHGIQAYVVEGASCGCKAASEMDSSACCKHALGFLFAVARFTKEQAWPQKISDEELACADVLQMCNKHPGQSAAIPPQPADAPGCFVDPAAGWIQLQPKLYFQQPALYIPSVGDVQSATQKQRDPGSTDFLTYTARKNWFPRNVRNRFGNVE